MKTRNSNLELLRIISIVMIVISHYSIHNGVSTYLLDFGFNKIFLEAITLGDIGSIIFVLISGYYLVHDKKFKLSKLVKLLLQILFYSISIFLVLSLIDKNYFSFKSLIKALLPISFNQYWFASCYAVLFVFHTYINKLLDSLTRKEHLKLIIISLLIFSIFHMITTSNYYGNDLIQFIMFYIIGAYFGKYDATIFSNKKLDYIILALSFVIIISSIIVFELLGIKYPIFSVHARYLLNRTSIFSILIGISLLNIFKSKKEKHNKYINLLASTVFGVYLISDNNYIRKILWMDLLKNSLFVNSSFILLHLLISLVIVFAFCMLIELVRINTIDKQYNNYLSPVIDKLQSKISSLYEKKAGVYNEE